MGCPDSPSVRRAALALALAVLCVGAQAGQPVVFSPAPLPPPPPAPVTPPPADPATPETPTDGTVAMSADIATGSVSIGDGSSAGGISSVAIGTNSSTSEDYTVSFGSPGEPRRLVFVAPGVKSTDAVNRGQLDAVQAATDAVAAQLHGDAVQIGAGANAALPGGVAVGAGAFAESEVSVAIGSGAYAASSIAIGAGSQAVGLNTTAVGDFAAATGSQAVAVGDHAEAQADNSVALGANSVATRANSVEVGNRQITGLAAGTASSDAATLGQLNALSDQLSARIRSLDSRFDKLAAGVAIAMAAAQPVVLDKRTRTAVSLGAGHFDGHSAGAVSLSHLADEDGRLVVSASAGLSGSTSAFRAGVSWSF